ncbi:MAG: aminotransferase class I/II-fold pyridoxal phosphate-dependent enzyme [Betaproteobacteria bacterium]|nr:aminotransferase class I/II-fold pyridoxal phosphate-dependent enzyme [Betaproteobacteria bacterium]
MSANTFALTGAKPLFERPLRCGQNYFPSRERYEAAFSGIFARQYYNNNGPLHEQLEARLQEFLGVRHVVCTSNAMLGLMIAADALQLRGKVIVPAFAHPGTIQSLSWAGLEAVWCDVDPHTQQIDIENATSLIDNETSAILAVNAWGGACDAVRLQQIADAYGLRLYFDSAHAFGCTTSNGRTGGFGHAEVFSMHSDMILGAGDGGCIATNDDLVALRARSIRPSYGLEQPASIVRVANARLSEAQAAIALMNLDDFPVHQTHNRALRTVYAQGLADIPGLTLHEPAGIDESNWQHLVLVVDASVYGLSRDRLIELLVAENVHARRGFTGATHLDGTQHLPNAARLYATCLELPLGAQVTSNAIERICTLLSRARRFTASLRGHHDQ